MSRPEGSCPYCQCEDLCDHLLLQVDLTFRDAVGGALYTAFRDKWLSVLDENSENEDFDESESFEALLELVTNLADAECYWEFEGGPGQSCDYQAYFCRSAESIAEAINNWNQAKL